MTPDKLSLKKTSPLCEFKIIAATNKQMHMIRHHYVSADRNAALLSYFCELHKSPLHFGCAE